MNINLNVKHPVPITRSEPLLKMVSRQTPIKTYCRYRNLKVSMKNKSKKIEKRNWKAYERLLLWHSVAEIGQPNQGHWRDWDRKCGWCQRLQHAKSRRGKKKQKRWKRQRWLQSPTLSSTICSILEELETQRSPLEVEWARQLRIRAANCTRTHGKWMKLRV